MNRYNASETEQIEQPGKHKAIPVSQGIDGIGDTSSHPILELQQTIGNRAVGQLIQTKETDLPDNLKTGVETISGLPMNDVKVHYNSPEPAKIDAHAYTKGRDIHVAPGQEENLPHEAWHAVQQKQGRVKPTGLVKQQPLNDEIELENEADGMGRRINQTQTGGLDSPWSSSAALQPKAPRAMSQDAAPIQRKLILPINEVKASEDEQDEKTALVDIEPSFEKQVLKYQGANQAYTKGQFKNYKKEHRDRLEKLNRKVRGILKRRMGNRQKPRFWEAMIWGTMQRLDRSKKSYNAHQIADYIIQNIGPAGTTLEYADQFYTANLQGKYDVYTVEQATRLTKLFAVAIESTGELKRLTRKLANLGTGTQEIKTREFPGIKGMTRAAFKGVIKKDDNYPLLGDILASSIVYDNIEELANAIPEITSFITQSDKYAVKGFKNRFHKPSPQEYRDILINFALPIAGGKSGRDYHIGEIQLHIRNMINSKSAGHKLYEEEREISEQREFVDQPMIEDLKKGKSSYKNAGQLSPMKKHAQDMRKARGLGPARAGTIWGLAAEADEKSLEKAIATDKAKEDIIKGLQVKARDDIYSLAWQKEKEDFSNRHGTNFSLFVDAHNKIKAFKLKSDSSKEQTIEKAYQTMFGTNGLLTAHQIFLEDACEEIRNQSQLKYEVDWETLTEAPKSEFLKQGKIKK